MGQPALFTSACTRIHTLTQKLWRPANTNSQARTISQFTSTCEVAGTSTSPTYGGDAGHNRLQGFDLATSAAGNSATTSVTYQYNSAGDLLGDGLTSYLYDSEGRMESARTGGCEDAPTTKYAHNGLGQRVFATAPQYSGLRCLLGPPYRVGAGGRNAVRGRLAQGRVGQKRAEPDFCASVLPWLRCELEIIDFLES